MSSGRRHRSYSGFHGKLQLHGWAVAWTKSVTGTAAEGWDRLPGRPAKMGGEEGRRSGIEGRSGEEGGGSARDRGIRWILSGRLGIGWDAVWLGRQFKEVWEGSIRPYIGAAVIQITIPILGLE